ncbi:MAG: ATP-binding cassette domain-containing protein, partial [Burkholderiales bacterium]
LTVLENVLLGIELAQTRWLARLFGARRRAAIAKALEMIEAVGLSEARDKYPAALSGGMQQRLAFAQSLVCKPKILLLDEPFGALDPGIRADMQALALELWRSQGLTVFLVTHDIPEAFGLGTRLLVFDNSRRDPRAMHEPAAIRAPGTRLLVFDKVRRDPQAAHAYGATITYDIPLRRKERNAVQSLSSATSP